MLFKNEPILVGPKQMSNFINLNLLFLFVQGLTPVLEEKNLRQTSVVTM